MLEAIVLGAAQGIAEWLPVSSEAVLVLLQAKLFGQESFQAALQMALWLHAGSALAALVYYRKTIAGLLSSVTEQSWRKNAELQFYVLGTLISGLVGGSLFWMIKQKEPSLAGGWIMLVIGVLLLVTAALLFFGRRVSGRGQALRIKDGVIVGLVQGLAVLPGVSRSGSTTAALLLLGKSKEKVFEYSFILGIPLILGANVVLNIGKSSVVDAAAILAAAISFIVSLATIHGLTFLARRVDFSYLVLGFGLITIAAALI